MSVWYFFLSFRAKEYRLVLQESQARSHLLENNVCYANVYSKGRESIQEYTRTQIKQEYVDWQEANMNIDIIMKQ